MSCADFLDLIELHIEGQATPEQEAQLQSHLAGCESCRALLDAYEEIQTGVASLEAEPPERFASGVMYRVSREAGGAPAKKKRFAFGRVTGIAAVAAALVLLIGTGLIELPGWGGTKSESSSAVADTEAAVTVGASSSADAGAAPALMAPAAAAGAENGADAGESGSDDVSPAESYDEVFTAMDGMDGAPAGTAQYAGTERNTGTDSAEAAEAERPSPMPEAVMTDDASDYAVRAELYGSVDAGAIPELDTLDRSEDDPNCYYGTAAEILALVEKYEADFEISCSVRSGYGDNDPACLVIVP